MVHTLQEETYVRFIEILQAYKDAWENPKQAAEAIAKEALSPLPSIPKEEEPKEHFLNITVPVPIWVIIFTFIVLILQFITRL